MIGQMSILLNFAKEFLNDKQSTSKLFHDELDVICELTLTYTGVKMYNKSSTKKEKVDQLICNIHKISLFTKVNATLMIYNHHIRMIQSQNHYFNGPKKKDVT